MCYVIGQHTGQYLSRAQKCKHFFACSMNIVCAAAFGGFVLHFCEKFQDKLFSQKVGKHKKLQFANLSSYNILANVFLCKLHLIVQYIECSLKFLPTTSVT